MAKKYDVVAVTGKYQAQDGSEKNRYLNIGAVISTKNGFMLKLEAVPVGWDGWAFLNGPEVRGEQPAKAAKPAPKAGFEDIADDITF